jgi:hypothetical protein
VVPEMQAKVQASLFEPRTGKKMLPEEGPKKIIKGLDLSVNNLPVLQDMRPN